MRMPWEREDCIGNRVRQLCALQVLVARRLSCCLGKCPLTERRGNEAERPQIRRICVAGLDVGGPNLRSAGLTVFSSDSGFILGRFCWRFRCRIGYCQILKVRDGRAWPVVQLMGKALGPCWRLCQSLFVDMAISVRTIAEYCVGCGLAVALLVVGCVPEPAAEPPSAEEVAAVVQEIMSVREFSRSPEPNHAGTKLAYIRASDQGNALWELDLIQGRTRMLPRKEQARRLFDWSPDDRYLLLRDFDSDETLTMYDANEGSFRPAMLVKTPKGGQVAWLATAGQVAWVGTNGFAYVGNQDGTAELRVATLDGQERKLTTVSPPRARDLLVRMSETELAFLSSRELWSFNLATSRATQLTTNLSQDYLWLNYSKENGAFLYCCDDDSEWRHLYRLDLGPGGLRKPAPLTSGPEHTYNGQWIQGGKGFAYVGSLTNHFYLAVRTASAEANTNLFLGGYVHGYKVAADGNRVFAVASVGSEPCGTWEYDIAARHLRCLVPGTDPFKVSQIIPATEHWVKSFDGVKVPCYRLEPRNFNPGKKYPLVIAVPHRDGMFDWAWGKYPQFLANIGVQHLAVNVRGSDGYGRGFRQNHPELADRDVLAVREAAVRGGNVDEKRIFLMAHSSGGEIVTKLAAEHPNMWAGVILVNPVLSVPNEKPGKLPRHLIFTGENDSKNNVAARAHEFEKWARTNGVPVTMIYDENTSHFIVDINVDKRMGVEIAEFIFQQKYGEATTERHRSN